MRDGAIPAWLGGTANYDPINSPANMKTPTNCQLHIVKISLAAAIGALILTLGARVSRADETCSSPYLARIDGQEEFVYVWTLGVEGMGDGADKLVTVDVKPGSPTYGKVVSSSSVEGRNEAHHGGFTDDRRQLWLAGLESSRVFIFDVHSDPAKPKLTKTIDNFAETTGGAVGPHGDVGFPCPPAEKSFPSAGRAARNPLGLGSQSQLRVYRHSANVETLVSLRGRSRRMASEGGRADR